MFFFYINFIVAPSCTAVPTTSLVNRTTATSWTMFAYNYTAVSTMPILMFGFTSGTNSYILLDSVSVVDNSASSVEILNNPGFDNSTTNATGWATWCSTSCGAGFPARILTNNTCRAGSCILDRCRNPNYDYLYQPFPTMIGRTYTISFWVQLVGFSTMRFTANIQK